MGRKIKDVATIDKVEKQYKVPLSNLISPKAFSCSLAQIAELTGILLDIDDYKKVMTFKQTDWDNLSANESLLTAFCTQYDGWLVAVTDDYEDDTAWVFGDAFPILFSQENWSFGSTFPILFSTEAS